MGFRNLTKRYNNNNEVSEDSNNSSRSGLSQEENNNNDGFQYQDPRTRNPFAAGSESGIGSNPDSQSSLISNVHASVESEVDREHPDYTGYYSKPEHHSNYLATPGNNNNSNKVSTSYSKNHSLTENELVFATPPFDRYPVVNPKLNVQDPKPPVLTATPLPVGSQHSNLNIIGDSLGSSSSSSNIYALQQDFSPFGGYPASSFPLSMDEKEDDDYIHNPDPEEDARLDRRRFLDDIKHMNRRSFGGLIGLIVLFLGGIAIFVVLPALTFTGAVQHSDHGADGRGSSGQGSSLTASSGALTKYRYPMLAALRINLVDPDTPSSAETRKAKDGTAWKLVFSDEFNAEGRTFYDGDDQFWTAPDIHYDATKDLEWYSPDAVTTKNGTLKLRMDAFRNHDLYYRSGMLQSWNKVCFTQGILEISANLPNYGSISGLWPGLWTMGNLGRPGYLASTEGVWPYSYSSCDAGITPNQSSPDGISYLPGQKLSACTCDGEDHPNPGVGRGAPEIDILEGEVDSTILVGVASQSMQIAPFDIWYMPDYDFIEIYNYSTTTMNTYAGGPFQQAISAISTLNTSWYEYGQEAGYYQKYAIEYLNDKDTGYIRWFVGDTPTFTIYSKALHPNGNIGWRLISQEPMSMVMNLGISNNWAYINWQMIYFPVTMSVDYVRLYQPSNAISLTCDPADFPTYDYIEAHKSVYTNANLTHWVDAGYSIPKNSLTGKCKSSKFKN